MLNGHYKINSLLNGPYYECKAFRLLLSVAIVFITLAFFLLSYAAWHEGYSFCFKKIICYQSFIEIYKGPIAIVSAFIVLFTFLGLAHKSHETQIQIQLAQEKNTFDQYVSHRKLFSELMHDFFDKRKLTYVSLSSVSALYNSVFPKNSFSNLELYSDLVEFKDVCRTIEKLLSTNSGFYCLMFKKMFDKNLISKSENNMYANRVISEFEKNVRDIFKWYRFKSFIPECVK